MAGWFSRPYREPSSGVGVLLGRSGALLCMLAAAAAVGVAADKSADTPDAARVTAVRFWSLGDTTRIAVEVSGEFHFKSENLHNPERLYFDVFGARPEMVRHGVEAIPVDDAVVKQLRVAETQPGVTRVVIDIKQAVTISTSQLNNPNRLIVEVKAKDAKPKNGKATEDDQRVPLVVSSVLSGGRILPDPSAAPVSNNASPAPLNPAPVPLNATPAKPESKPAAAPKTATTAATKTEVKTEVKTENAKADVMKTDPAKPVSPKADSDIKTRSEAKYRPEAKTTPDSKAKLDADAKSKPLVELASAKESARPAPLAKVASFNPLPISVSTDSANLDSSASPRSGLDSASDKALVASLPPEPIGVEPPASAIELKKDALDREDAKRSNVKEVLPAKRGAFGDRTLTRTLGLKLGRIVIDPGHGGNDVGTHGPSGYYEKELTLDVARRLAAVIRENTGSEAILTRSDDEYVGLEERTRLANEKKADLFVSIHANSSPYRPAAGVETYVLSFTTSRTAMELASRENASSELGIHDLRDVLQKIALRDKVDESQELATRLQTSLSALSTSSNKAAINRGVKKAPFVVLIGANMPSVLAEIGFLSNSADETLLRKPEHRQKIAEALYKGISNYADTLSQVVARKN